MPSGIMSVYQSPTEFSYKTGSRRQSSLRDGLQVDSFHEFKYSSLKGHIHHVHTDHTLYVDFNLYLIWLGLYRGNLNLVINS